MSIFSQTVYVAAGLQSTASYRVLGMMHKGLVCLRVGQQQAAPQLCSHRLRAQGRMVWQE